MHEASLVAAARVCCVIDACVKSLAATRMPAQAAGMANKADR